MSYKLDNENNILSVVSEPNSKILVNADKKAIEIISDRSSGNGEKVAIRSTKNIYVEGLGKMLKGINIVPKSKSDYWLSKDYCTLLAPEEVAREYGVK
jgi:hypothetical protein